MFEEQAEVETWIQDVNTLIGRGSWDKTLERANEDRETTTKTAVETGAETKDA